MMVSFLVEGVDLHRAGLLHHVRLERAGVL
jgi:hypothetical protein